MGQPEYITFDEFNHLLQEQANALESKERLWWQTNRVEPFTAQDSANTRFVVAVADDVVIYFHDHEDEFAVGRLDQGKITDGGLAGDLTDAIGCAFRRLEIEP